MNGIELDAVPAETVAVYELGFWEMTTTSRRTGFGSPGFRRRDVALGTMALYRPRCRDRRRREAYYDFRFHVSKAPIPSIAHAAPLTSQGARVQGEVLVVGAAQRLPGLTPFNYPWTDRPRALGGASRPPCSRWIGTG